MTERVVARNCVSVVLENIPRKIQHQIETLIHLAINVLVVDIKIYLNIFLIKIQLYPLI